jgi:uncharacterized membrane protein YuzA (DUF378 family)
MISHRNNLYLEKKQYLLLIFIVLLGSFNYGILGITNINLINKLDILNPYISTIIYIIIALSGIYLLSSKKFMSPYVDNTSHPCDVIKDHIPNNSNFSYRLKVPPNVLVIYWSNESDNLILNKDLEPWNSFKNHLNAGVLRSNEYGNVELKLNKKKENHNIYYRYYSPIGFLSSLKKIYVK